MRKKEDTTPPVSHSEINECETDNSVDKIEISKENDEFKRSDLVKKLDFEFAKYADQDQSNELIERYKKFLMKLSFRC